jgi:hypothetical protein
MKIHDFEYWASFFSDFQVNTSHLGKFWGKKKGIESQGCFFLLQTYLSPLKIKVIYSSTHDFEYNPEL